MRQRPCIKVNFISNYLKRIDLYVVCRYVKVQKRSSPRHVHVTASKVRKSWCGEVNISQLWHGILRFGTHNTQGSVAGCYIFQIDWSIRGEVVAHPGIGLLSSSSHVFTNPESTNFFTNFYFSFFEGCKVSFSVIIRQLHWHFWSQYKTSTL